MQESYGVFSFVYTENIHKFLKVKRASGAKWPLNTIYASGHDSTNVLFWKENRNFCQQKVWVLPKEISQHNLLTP